MTSPEEPRRTAAGSRALVRSMGSLSWALTVSSLRFGGQAMWAPMAVVPSADLRRIAELGREQIEDAAAAVYRAGDRFQAAVVDLVFDAVEDELPLRRWLRAGMRLLDDSARAMSLMLPADTGIPWLELHNKLEAFRRFDGVEAALDLRPGAGLDLAPTVDRAAALGPFPALWTAEGLGHLHAERSGEDPRRLLDDPRLPDWSLVALHAGLGLGLASRVLAASHESAAGGELRRALDRFSDLCCDNAREGYAEVAFEALGLVARNLHPALVDGIDAELRRRDPAAADRFWHGVGRGLYFAPTQALPLGSWSRALHKIDREAPDRRARQNLLSGFAWALTLVNLRHPEVLAAFVRAHGAVAREDAWVQGVVAAILVWRAAAGREEILERFLDHRSPGWIDRVRLPCDEALDGAFESLARRSGLAALFRYQPLAELTEGRGR